MLGWVLYALGTFCGELRALTFQVYMVHFLNSNTQPNFSQILNLWIQVNFISRYISYGIWEIIKPVQSSQTLKKRVQHSQNSSISSEPYFMLVTSKPQKWAYGFTCDYRHVHKKLQNPVFKDIFTQTKKQGVKRWALNQHVRKKKSLAIRPNVPNFIKSCVQLT